ncbi:hypothetical protein DPMN_096482 [Dreissena polymorpha]|uniref:Uncharacterized protein n=1 Tax=Dreissena polymorpha TaxID=45954 RepID=A0A9D4L9U8_DREPO|nr:hypothetical protein DPMN_096482 [Dreissena polymorpha]
MRINRRSKRRRSTIIRVKRIKRWGARVRGGTTGGGQEEGRRIKRRGCKMRRSKRMKMMRIKSRGDRVGEGRSTGGGKTTGQDEEKQEKKDQEDH